MVQLDIKIPKTCIECNYCDTNEDYQRTYCQIGQHDLNYKSVMGLDPFYKDTFKDRRCQLIPIIPSTGCSFCDPTNAHYNWSKSIQKWSDDNYAIVLGTEKNGSKYIENFIEHVKLCPFCGKKLTD